MDFIEQLFFVIEALFITGFLFLILSVAIGSAVKKSKEDAIRRKRDLELELLDDPRNREITHLKSDIKSRDEKIRQLNYDIEYLKKVIQQYKNKAAEEHLEQRKFIQVREQRIESNLTAIPYMAAIIADFETRELKILEKALDWGSDQKRLHKVKSIREIRKEATEKIAQYKSAQYQLDYAIKMFPALEDFLETDYRAISPIQFSDLTAESHDAAKDYLSKEEYYSLSTTERNQLALDRYRESRRKSNWQIGRDYELYVGYKYEAKGYTVTYFGSERKLEDLGRDLIAKKDNRTLIIQCKYWSSKKLIHEKHINQLYGTMVVYCYENNLPMNSVRGVLVTNITVSDTARKFAKYLDIEIVERYVLGEYPCIKCNINRSSKSGESHIYHLPFDQQYDTCQINSPGEFMAMTVAEAEAAGFRRAYRWHG